ncbi:MAG: DUF421 domain-containing protein [Clostridia bacterium]
MIIRLMGKRQIGEMQPFELVVTLILADVACTPMQDVSIPLLYGLTSLLCVFIIHSILSILNKKSLALRKVFSGKPAIIINPNGIDFDELKKQDLTISDLLEALRSQQVFSVDDVQFALLETNGKLSILPKDNSTVKTALPITIVSGGKFDVQGLDSIKKNKEFVEKILRKEKIKSVKSIILLTIDSDGNLFYQEKNKKYITKNISLIGGDNS